MNKQIKTLIKVGVFLIMIQGLNGQSGMGLGFFNPRMEGVDQFCVDIYIINENGTDEQAIAYGHVFNFNQNVFSNPQVVLGPGVAPGFFSPNQVSVNGNQVTIQDFSFNPLYLVPANDSLLFAEVCFTYLGSTEGAGLVWNRNPSITGYTDESSQSVEYEYYVDIIESVSNLLPIELLSFEVMKIGEYESRLEWATLSEVNNEYFELEHSLDGVEFRKIAEIDGAGHSQVQIDYAYVHEEPAPGLNYYRLKQVDYDGVYSYSDIRTVYFEPTYEVEVYPNPFMDELRIQHKYPHEVSIELMDSQSRVLRREKEIGSHHRMQMSEYPAGIYYLRVIDSEQVKLLQLVKN